MTNQSMRNITNFERNQGNELFEQIVQGAQFIKNSPGLSADKQHDFDHRLPIRSILGALLTWSDLV